MTELIAKVAVENAAYSFDDAFDYAILPEQRAQVQPGVRVIVPFGKGSRKRQGLVFALRENKHPEKKLKAIAEVLDPAPLLNAELLRLAVFLKEHTFCTLFEAAKAMLPSGIGLRFVLSYLANPDILAEKAASVMSDSERTVFDYLCDKGIFVRREKLLEELGLPQDSRIPEEMVSKGFLLRNTDAHRRVGDATVKMARLTEAYLQRELTVKLTKKQKDVVALLENVGSASVKEICYFTGVTPAVVSTLAGKGVAELFQNEVFRRPQFQRTSSVVPSSRTRGLFMPPVSRISPPAISTISAVSLRLSKWNASKPASLNSASLSAVRPQVWSMSGTSGYLSWKRAVSSLCSGKRNSS